MSDATVLVRRIAAIDLDREGSLDDDGGVAISANDGDDVLRILRDQRIEGVAVHALSTGRLDADETFIAALIRQHDETMAKTLRIELMALKTSRLLTDIGVEHRLLKGAALAHTVAGNPAHRSFRDVDVLVPGRSIDQAVAALEAAGAARSQAQLRRGFDARFGKSVTMTLDDVEVDVHRLLAPGPFGVWMRPNDLFLLRSTVTIGGENIPTLDATDHLVHACYHVAIGSPEPALANLRDVAQLAAAQIDRERFAQTVDRWRGRAAVRRAVRLVEDQLQIGVPMWLSRYRHEPVDARELAAIEPYLTNDPRGRFAALAPATLRALPIADRLAFVRAVGLPADADPKRRIQALVKRVRH